MSLVAESLGYWDLPKPEEKEKIKWLPIPRVSKTVPFGYKVDEEDDKILVPIDEELDALEQAKKYIRQYSYREVANWLSTTTERHISHEGLRKRITNERSRKKAASTKRNWAKRYEEAIATAEKIEKERVGARETDS